MGLNKASTEVGLAMSGIARQDDYLGAITYCALQVSQRGRFDIQRVLGLLVLFVDLVVFGRKRQKPVKSRNVLVDLLAHLSPQERRNRWPRIHMAPCSPETVVRLSKTLTNYGLINLPPERSPGKPRCHAAGGLIRRARPELLPGIAAAILRPAFAPGARE